MRGGRAFGISIHDPPTRCGECGATSEYQDDARVLYSRLPKAVEEAFVRNSRAELDDQFVVLHEVPNVSLEYLLWRNNIRLSTSTNSHSCVRFNHTPA